MEDIINIFGQIFRWHLGIIILNADKPLHFNDFINSKTCILKAIINKIAAIMIFLRNEKNCWLGTSTTYTENLKAYLPIKSLGNLNLVLKIKGNFFSPTPRAISY